MELSFILNFLKELAVGYKSAKSYPPGHPVMQKVITSTMGQLSKLYIEISEFSMYFLEQTIIFQDLRIDVGKNLAVLALMDALRKNDINSLTFLSGVTPDDVKNLYEVISSGKLRIKEYGDAASMLTAKGTEKIKINEVKFGIQTGTTVQVAKETKGIGEGPSREDFIEAIRNLKELVEKGISLLETKSKFVEAAHMLEEAPSDSASSYRDAVARILEQLPTEHRIELLKDVEFKPFMLKLFSHLGDETLVDLIINKAQDKNQTDVTEIITAVGEDRFSKLLPQLKEQIPDFYEYLAQVGLLLSEKISLVISKDDLRISIRPYFTMLDSQNPHLREEGMRSLTTLAGRFIEQQYLDLAEEIILRITVALEQEGVEEVVLKAVEPLSGLYKICETHHQDKFCKSILEPFNRILGRPGLSTQFKKTGIKFLSETNNPVVLSALFSFLWETGLYTDVRAAIIKFGKEAVTEALLTLKEAEDYSLRMKLVDILKNIGKEAVDILVKNLDAPEWFLRRNIVATLGDIGDKSIIPNLMGLLEDKDDRVRLEIVRAFTKFEYEEGLLKCLNDPSMEVKAEALRGLKKMITAEEIKELLPLFKEKGDALHIELFKLIGERKVSEAADAIVEFLNMLQTRDDPHAQELKELGIITLVKLSVPDLKQILEEFKLSKDRILVNLSTAVLKKIG